MCRNGRQGPPIVRACPEVGAGQSLLRARLEGAQPESQYFGELRRYDAPRTCCGRTMSYREYCRSRREHAWFVTARQTHGATPTASSRCTRRCSQTLPTVKTPPRPACGKNLNLTTDPRQMKEPLLGAGLGRNQQTGADRFGLHETRHMRRPVTSSSRPLVGGTTDLSRRRHVAISGRPSH